VNAYQREERDTRTHTEREYRGSLEGELAAIGNLDGEGEVRPRDHGAAERDVALESLVLLDGVLRAREECRFARRNAVPQHLRQVRVVLKPHQHVALQRDELLLPAEQQVAALLDAGLIVHKVGANLQAE
jgi:hypothetical protein